MNKYYENEYSAHWGQSNIKLFETEGFNSSLKASGIYPAGSGSSINWEPVGRHLTNSYDPSDEKLEERKTIALLPHISRIEE